MAVGYQMLDPNQFSDTYNQRNRTGSHHNRAGLSKAFTVLNYCTFLRQNLKSGNCYAILTTVVSVFL